MRMWLRLVVILLMLGLLGAQPVGAGSGIPRAGTMNLHQPDFSGDWVLLTDDTDRTSSMRDWLHQDLLGRYLVMSTVFCSPSAAARQAFTGAVRTHYRASDILRAIGPVTYTALQGVYWQGAYPTDPTHVFIDSLLYEARSCAGTLTVIANMRTGAMARYFGARLSNEYTLILEQHFLHAFGLREVPGHD